MFKAQGRYRKKNGMESANLQHLQPWQMEILSGCVKFEDDYEYLNGVYGHSSLVKAQERTVWRESLFYQRSVTKYTTTFCEQQLAERILDNTLKKTAIDRRAIVADAGCGDGRFVHYLLRKDFDKIVAINYEIEPLLGLEQTLDFKDKKKVFLLCTDILENPLALGICDLVLAWTLFTSTKDFAESLRKCLDLLKPQGYLFNAEPILEHSLIYSLVMNDLEEFRRILKTKTRARMWDQKNFRYSVKTMAEIDKMMNDADIEILFKGGINVLPSLVFGGLLVGKNIEAETKEQIWQEMQDSDFSWCRQITYLSKKR